MRKQDEPDAVLNIQGDDLKDVDKLSWLMKLFLSIHMCYPYISPAYVSKHINKPTTSQAELRQYQKKAERGQHAIIIYCVVFGSFMLTLIKSITLPLVIFCELDLKNLEANIVMLDDNTYQFSCLVSNCTSLGQKMATEKQFDSTASSGRNRFDLEQLATTLISLPYFSLCHPQLSKFHDPFQHCDEYGILITAIFGVGTLLASLVLAFLLFCKAGNLLLMFLVAPQVTRRVVKESAEQKLHELSSSRQNYRIQLSKHRDNFLEHAIYNSTGGCCLAHQGVIIDVHGVVAASRHNHSPDQKQNHEHNLNNSYKQPLEYPVRHRYSALKLSIDRQVNFLLPRAYDGGLTPLAEKRKHWQQLDGLQELDEEELEGFVPTCENSETAAWDCVTAMRSRWWRARAIVCLHFLMALVGSVVFWGTLGLIYLVFFFIPQKQDHVNEIGLGMKNCSIWLLDGTDPLLSQTSNSSVTDWRRAGRLNTDGETSIGSMGALENAKVVQLGQLKLEFSLFRSIIYVIQYFLPFIGYTSFVATFLTTGEELTGWLCECKFELLLGTEFVKQLVSSSAGTGETSDSNDQYSPAIVRHKTCRHRQPHSHQYFDFYKNIRSKFTPLTGISFMIFDCKFMGYNCLPTSSRLESEQAIKKYVAERIVADKLCLCSAVELLEKFHTSFRIFVEHVHWYGPTITIMIASINVCIYVYIINEIILIRSIKEFLYTPLLFLLTTWSFTNIVTVLASNFNAKATKLHTLIWSLIAATSKCPDIRIEHMRRLFLKQVEALDLEGGLALKALGLRITYTKVVQLVVGSGTVVVLLLR